MHVGWGNRQKPIFMKVLNESAEACSRMKIPDRCLATNKIMNCFYERVNAVLIKVV